MSALSNKDLKIKIIEIYDTKIKRNLESYALEIAEIFENIFNFKLEENPEGYSLTHNNAGYLGRYYKITHRVKSGWSLGEKLVKKDDLLILKYTIDYNDENEIENYLKERYTDLIGIKILGDLKLDTRNIFALIKDNKNKFKNAEGTSYITFENLDKQPDYMKNGMEIYKVDCLYHREGYRLKFELQIKSQLTSAWGDMEHQQFYKNNRFSLVRKSNEPIMSDIGQLLEKTDQLLLTIRKSENNYSENEELWNFTSDLQQNFSEKLMNILEVNVDSSLTDTAGFLLLLYKQIKPRKSLNLELEILEGLKNGLLDLDDCEDLCVNNFINHRKLTFRLQILEIITFIWYGSLTEIEYSRENYKGLVKRFIQDLLGVLQEKYEIDTESEVRFDEIFYHIVSYSTQSKVFIDITSYKDIISYYKFTKDLYLEMKEEEEEVFPLEVFYLINYLYSRNNINGEKLEDMPIHCEGHIDLTLLDSFFEYLMKEAKGSINSMFLEISNHIHLRIRGGL